VGTIEYGRRRQVGQPELSDPVILNRRLQFEIADYFAMKMFPIVEEKKQGFLQKWTP
jgi:hypothetical protein